MVKFVSGIVIGALLTALGIYLYFPPQARWTALDMASGVLGPSMQHPAIDAYYNLALGEEYDTEQTMTVLEDRHLKIIERKPVHTLHPSDIARVCLQPVWYDSENEYLSNYTVEVVFTPAAKKAVAAALAPYEGRHLSYQMTGFDLGYFLLSEDKRQRFGRGEDTGSNGVDLEFSVPLEASLSGLIYAYELAGPGRLEMCQPGDTFEQIPHYAALMQIVEAGYDYWQKRTAATSEALAN
jgi:hypothetical protein